MDIEIIIALYVAILSTILGINTIILSRQQSKRSVGLKATINEKNGDLLIEFHNLGFRAYTIVSIQLLFGTHSNVGQILLEIDLKSILGKDVLKQEIEDYYKFNLTQENICKEVVRRKIKQKYNQKLWLKARLSTNQTVSVLVLSMIQILRIMDLLQPEYLLHMIYILDLIK
jgi:hypothetical protein